MPSVHRTRDGPDAQRQRPAGPALVHDWSLAVAHIRGRARISDQPIRDIAD
jgi:hypothetical protein